MTEARRPANKPEMGETKCRQTYCEKGKSTILHMIVCEFYFTLITMCLKPEVKQNLTVNKTAVYFK